MFNNRAAEMIQEGEEEYDAQKRHGHDQFEFITSAEKHNPTMDR